MNPMLFIPFVFVPIINAIGLYRDQTGLAGAGCLINAMDYTCSNWRLLAANWALSPVVMCIICMVMSALMYLPFLRAYERSLLKSEEQKAQDPVSVANAARSNS